MNSDRYSRISALRPAHGAPQGTGSAEHSGWIELAGLVSGESRRNDFGEHLAVRRLVIETRAPSECLNCIRRISAAAPAEAADPQRWLFLDTETTGLTGGTGTYAFMIGLAWWEPEGLVIEQLLMRDHREEPSLLWELSERMKMRSVLVTYNGKSFDWPLLETRFRMTRLVQTPSVAGHLDLLHPARQIWRFRLRSFALSEVEREILGLLRDYDIPSETIPARYFQFLRSGIAVPLAEVFDHNRMDLVGLVTLAQHMVRVLENPFEADLAPAELYGISRVLRRRGEAELAVSACEDALARGLERDPGRQARRDLAADARRRGDYTIAKTHLRDLLDATPAGLIAYEQLSIIYEHRLKQPGRAAALVREALNRLREALNAGTLAAHSYRQWHGRFQHRLDRLQTKCALGEMGHPAGE